MNKTVFIYKIWSKSFRYILDNLLTFTDSHSRGFSSMPYRFDRFLTRFYNIDKDIDSYIRKWEIIDILK